MSRPAGHVTFTGSKGETLSARLDMPFGEPRAFALFAHCFTCSKDSLAAGRISAELATRGFGVLRFDFTGIGQSGGEFSNTDFSSNVADIVHAADWLRAHHAAPALLVGHSLGGAAVLAAAGDIPEARAVATIGAPADAEHVKRAFADDLDRIAAEGEATVTLAGREFRIAQSFVEDLASQRLLDHVAHLRRALLVLHAPLDDIVGIDNATELFVAAKHPKSFVSLDKADHLLTDKADAIYAADLIAAWAVRYVGEPAVEALPSAHRGVIVAETGQGRYQQAVSIGPHRLTGDEPEAVGGGSRNAATW